MTSPGGASRYYEVNYVLIPCLLIQTGLSRGIWSMPKSDISISAELVISRHGITNKNEDQIARLARATKASLIFADSRILP